jgi:hypothetical protein
MRGSSWLDIVLRRASISLTGSCRPKQHRTTVVLELPSPAIIGCSREQNHCVSIVRPRAAQSMKSSTYLPGFAAATLRDFAADGRAWTSSFDRFVEDAIECSLTP